MPVIQASGLSKLKCLTFGERGMIRARAKVSSDRIEAVKRIFAIAMASGLCWGCVSPGDNEVAEQAGNQKRSQAAAGTVSASVKPPYVQKREYLSKSLGSGVAEILIAGWSSSDVIDEFGSPDSTNSVNESLFLKSSIGRELAPRFDRELVYRANQGATFILMKDDKVVRAIRRWSSY